MSTEKDIAERLRAAFVQHHGNKVGDPFVSQIAREIAAAASAIEARRAETGTGSVHESAVREAGTPIPSLVGEVVEAARAYLISTRASADTRPKRELKAALSALDAAPRIRVEEVAREIMVADDCGLTVKGERVLCDHPLALGRNKDCGCRKAARAVLSLLASGVPADERAAAAEAKLAEAERRIERLLLTQRRLFEGDHVRLLEEAEERAVKAVIVLGEIARAVMKEVEPTMGERMRCVRLARAFLASPDKEKSDA